MASLTKDTMRRQAGFVIALIIHTVLSAPVLKKDDVDKRRETTPEILDLEKQLKKAAGEDKQFFTGPNSQPMAQIDGLSDELPEGMKPETPPAENDIAQQLAVSDNAEMQPGEDVVAQETPGSVSDQSEMTLEDAESAPLSLDEDGEDDIDEKELMFYNKLWMTFRDHPEYLQQLLEEAEYTPQDIEELYLRGQYAALQADNKAGDMYPYEPEVEDSQSKRGSMGYGEDDGSRFMPVLGQLGYAQAMVPSDADDRLAALEAEMAQAAGRGAMPVLPYGGEGVNDGGHDGSIDSGVMSPDVYGDGSDPEAELEAAGRQRISGDVYGQQPYGDSATEPKGLPYRNEIYELYSGDKTSHHVAKKGSKYQPDVEVNIPEGHFEEKESDNSDVIKTDSVPDEAAMDKDVEDMLETAKSEAKVNTKPMGLPIVM